MYWAKSQQGNLKIHQEIVDVEDAIMDVLDQEMGSAINKSIELGAFAYLVKADYSLNEVVEKVEKALEK